MSRAWTTVHATRWTPGYPVRRKRQTRNQIRLSRFSCPAASLHRPIEDAEPGNWKLDMRRGLDWLGLQCSCTNFFFFFFFGESVSRLPCLLLWYYITKMRCATGFARGTVQWYCSLCMAGFACICSLIPSLSWLSGLWGSPGDRVTWHLGRRWRNRDAFKGQRRRVW
jgi:hypothetical protein